MSDNERNRAHEGETGETQTRKADDVLEQNEKSLGSELLAKMAEDLQLLEKKVKDLELYQKSMWIPRCIYCEKRALLFARREDEIYPVINYCTYCWSAQTATLMETPPRS